MERFWVLRFLGFLCVVDLVRLGSGSGSSGKIENAENVKKMKYVENMERMKSMGEMRNMGEKQIGVMKFVREISYTEKENLHFSILLALKQRNLKDAELLLQKVSSIDSASYGEYLTAEEWGDNFGCENISDVEKYVQTEWKNNSKAKISIAKTKDFLSIYPLSMVEVEKALNVKISIQVYQSDQSAVAYKISYNPDFALSSQIADYVDFVNVSTPSVPSLHNWHEEEGDKLNIKKGVKLGNISVRELRVTNNLGGYEASSDSGDEFPNRNDPLENNPLKYIAFQHNARQNYRLQNHPPPNNPVQNNPLQNIPLQRIEAEGNVFAGYDESDTDSGYGPEMAGLELNGIASDDSGVSSEIGDAADNGYWDEDAFLRDFDVSSFSEDLDEALFSDKGKPFGEQPHSDKESSSGTPKQVTALAKNDNQITLSFEDDLSFLRLGRAEGSSQSVATGEDPPSLPKNQLSHQEFSSQALSQHAKQPQTQGAKPKTYKPFQTYPNNWSSDTSERSSGGETSNEKMSIEKINTHSSELHKRGEEDVYNFNYFKTQSSPMLSYAEPHLEARYLDKPSHPDASRKSHMDKDVYDKQGGRSGAFRRLRRLREKSAKKSTQAKSPKKNYQQNSRKNSKQENSANKNLEKKSAKNSKPNSAKKNKPNSAKKNKPNSAKKNYQKNKQNSTAQNEHTNLLPEYQGQNKSAHKRWAPRILADSVETGTRSLSFTFVPLCFRFGGPNVDKLANRICHSEKGMNESVFITSFEAIIYQRAEKVTKVVQLPVIWPVVEEVDFDNCPESGERKNAENSETKDSEKNVRKNGKCIGLKTTIGDINYYLKTRIAIRSKFSNGFTTEFSAYSEVPAVWIVPTVSPLLLEQLYGLPQHLTIKHNSVQIALVEFLEQYYAQSDLDQFFKYTGVRNKKNVPHVVGPNLEEEVGDEAQLDVEYAMALAPNASTWFWSVAGRNPETLQEPFIQWMFQLSCVSDEVLPKIHSISYGDDETSFPPHLANRLNTEFLKLALRGLTVLVSSGDDGAYGAELRDGGECKGLSVPSMPSSSPFVTAVGGTQLSNASQPISLLVRDVQGNAEKACMRNTGGVITSGGGFSNYFPQPYYQKQAVGEYLSYEELPPSSFYNSSGRGYPDVSVYANSFAVCTKGEFGTVNGTSASAPVFAAMVAHWNDLRAEQNLPSLGFINPLLYQMADEHPEAFNDILMGNNKCGTTQCCNVGFTCKRGWDPVTGVGSPKFNIIYSLLKDQYNKPKSNK